MPIHLFPVKIGTWNILNYPGPTDFLREDDFRRVLDRLDLDILVIQDMISVQGVSQFLNNVLNYSVPDKYTAAQFLDGPDTDNMLFFKKSMVSLLSQKQIVVPDFSASHHDISEYNVSIISGPESGLAFRIFSLNFEEGTQLENQQRRLLEAQTLRGYLNGLPAGDLFILCGSFNMNSSDEDAFQMLLQAQIDNDGRVKDPANRLGYWHDAQDFSDLHTESSREVQIGGGAAGGLDDRFDLILLSYGFDVSQDLSYKEGSYDVYGNDGAHLNKAVNALIPGNTLRVFSSVDAETADSLYQASDHLPVLIELVSPTEIFLTSPNGGELLPVGSQHNITWTPAGAASEINLEYSVDNGLSWDTIDGSTPDDGIHAWEVPDNPSTQCLVKISSTAPGRPSDVSDSVFSIVLPGIPEIAVTSPDGGERWIEGTTHSITWTSSGMVGSLDIEYSTDGGAAWSAIIGSTDNDGFYSWLIPDETSSRCLIRISESAGGGISDVGNGFFSILSAALPSIYLNRTKLEFGATTTGVETSAQDVLISNSGGRTLYWTAVSDSSWLNCSQTSGTEGTVIWISVPSVWLSPAVYKGSITVSSPSAGNSPQYIHVTLRVMWESSPPFGMIDAPVNGSIVRGNLPITGWVLDDIGVESVKIYRNPFGGENPPSGLLYIGDAVFVEGARPDVELSYPDFPMNSRAGWGYMMLSNFLPNKGNGPFTIYAEAADKEGNRILLGQKTITCDNANAAKPFGTIDTPRQGGITFAAGYLNWGWVLTPLPKSIPTDGSTIQVWVDGTLLGSPAYNLYRVDIASLFPAYANSSGAVGVFSLDTTAYANGIHTIQWTAQDSAGNSDGIGSRYFSVQNLDGNVSTDRIIPHTYIEAAKLPSALNPLSSRMGYSESSSRRIVNQEGNGEFHFESWVNERIEIEFHNPVSAGYLIVGESLRPLPIGSTLDFEAGKFHWHPGPGFLGEYRLVFLTVDNEGTQQKNMLLVKILPEY